MRGSETLSFYKVSGIHTAMSRRREQRVLLMVVIMVVCYLLCWLPYGITALLATFGPLGLVTPEASIVPSLLAKTSTFINPIIYIFMNKQDFKMKCCFQGSNVCRQGDIKLRQLRSVSCHADGMARDVCGGGGSFGRWSISKSQISLAIWISTSRMQPNGRVVVRLVGDGREEAKTSNGDGYNSCRGVTTVRNADPIPHTNSS
ncbi:unnamed protein product [Gadus morhua 'NCC']